jgi:hypothetical protein
LLIIVVDVRAQVEQIIKNDHIVLFERVKQWRKAELVFNVIVGSVNDQIVKTLNFSIIRCHQNRSLIEVIRDIRVNIVLNKISSQFHASNRNRMM